MGEAMRRGNGGQSRRMVAQSDVIVVGAGPVGMLTALALVQGGASVTVLEKEPGIVESPRAAVYFPSTLIVLEELGLLDELLAIGFTNKTFGTHVPEFGYSSVVTTEPIEGIPYDYQLHAGQHDVARVAMEHAKTLGVEVLFEHEVTALEDGADGATLTVATPEGEKTFAAKWLIGADGARSTASSRNPMQARMPLLGLNELLDRHRHFCTLQAVASLKDNRCGQHCRSSR